jgi:hypothetical protein
MIPNLRHLEYEERLNRLHLMTLEDRRYRANLLEVYKIFKVLTDIKRELFSSPLVSYSNDGSSVVVVR